MNVIRRRSPWEDDDVAAFRDSVRRFLAQEAVPNELRWRKQKGVDRDLWRKAGEVGLLCPSVPEQYGGGGGTFAHEAVVAEELAHAVVSSFGQGVHGTIVAQYLLHYGTEEQKRRWLPRMSSGELVGAVAMTEPGAGSDLQAVATSAVRSGDVYVVNGSKTFITNGHQADLIVVVTKTDPSLGARGVTLVVAETKDLAGFSRGRNLDKIGLQGSDTAELFFEDVRLPVANRLGAEGEGFAQLMNQLPQERLIIAVSAQAIMERAVELTLEYVRERKVFGKPLLEMQNTRFKLAECATTVRASRAFLDECVAKHLRGELTAAEASMAKLWCTERQGEVVDECLQLFGGYGFMEEYPIARMYADARAGRIYGGANEVMKDLIARTF